MDPAFWGRSTWTYLHTLTFNYPENPTENDKLKYYNYFKQLPEFLPCPSCASSFKIYFEYIPITAYLNDIYGITFWLYIIHFIVNSKLKKKNTDFLQVIQMYLPNKTSCSTPSNQPVNLTGKCTKPSTSLPKNKFIDFQNISQEKYLEYTKQYISLLQKDHPTLI
jgi:hypothetical protein